MANPPPPYDNITGISRAVMKDNAQETLGNYNGNARPGELVVDLTQDPPPLYVGNNAGRLTLVSSGGSGAGLPLANGSSNFDIATSGGNVTIDVAGLETWTFDTNGNVTIPGSIVGTTTVIIDNRATGNSADINLFSADDITLQARDRSAGSGSEGGDINIYAGDSAEDSDSTGGDITIIAGNGGAANVDFGGNGGFITIQGGEGGAASTEVSGESALDGGDITIRAGAAGSNNGNIARGANGGDVNIQGGTSTGNLDVGGSIILTTGFGGTNAAAGSVTIDIPASDQGLGGEWLFVGTGNTLTTPADSEISSVAGNLKVGSAGNTIITSSGSTYTWTFSNTGTLTTPGPIQMAVYANATVRDAAITSPTPGMMIYVTGTGMQIRGATSWNTVTGSGT